jgi:hypothetical protein
MFKVPETYIASVAEKATDAVCRVAMVNMELSTSVKFCGFANGAGAVLGNKQFGMFIRCQTIGVLARVICMAFWVCLTMFLLFGRAVRKILKAPIIMGFGGTRFAPDLVAMDCCFASVKFGKWFTSLAAWAKFCARRKIDWCTAWHEELLVSV